MDVKYLDTCILAEIADGNKKFIEYIENQFIISDLTLAELYTVLLRDKNEETAEFWYNKLAAYAYPVSKEILREAVKFRHKHKKTGISFFDAVGYIFALNNKMKFVTGDKEFEKLENV